MATAFQSKHPAPIADYESDYGSGIGIDDAAAIEPVVDDASDYGSEIDDQTAIKILSQIESQPLKELVLESIEEPIISNENPEQPTTLRLPPFKSSLYSVDSFGNKIGTIVSERQVREASVEVEYEQGNRASFSRMFLSDIYIW